jgi:hypothetical protein
LAGQIYKQPPDPYYCPLFQVFDLEGEKIFEDVYTQDNSLKGFSDIIIRNGKEPVVMVQDLIPPTSWGHWVYSFIRMDEYYNPVQTIDIPIDSVYLIEYFDFLTDSTVQLVGEAIDSVFSWKTYTHKFYAEFNTSGEVIEMNRLGQFDEHLIENSDPLNIYHWSVAGTKESTLTLNKISETGNINYSRNIQMLENTFIEPSVQLIKPYYSDEILINGIFFKNNTPAAPSYYGAYLIKTDDSGNEYFRVIFNEDLDGYTSGGYIIPMENDTYIFLFNFFLYQEGMFSFCFSKIKVN